MPMRAFDDQTGWETAYEDSVYTAEALAADDAVAGLARPFEKLLDDWNRLEADRREARRAVVRANARVRVIDGRLDRVVGRIADAVLSVVGRRGFDNPLYRRIFPTSPTAIINLGLESQSKPVRAMLEQIADKETPAAIREAAKPAGPILTSGTKALAEREKAQTGATKVSTRISAWKRSANAARLSVQAGLLDYAAKNGLPKSFADDYFPPAPSKASRPAKDKSPAPTDKPTKSEPLPK